MSNPTVRLRHPQLRNANYAVELPGRPYHNPAGFDCPKCNRGRAVGAERVVHKFKTMHLDIDSEGYALMATELLPVLRTVPLMGGFEVANDLSNAPMQRIGAVEAPQQETVLSATDQRFYIPQRTKWEADRVTTDMFKRQLLEPLAEQHDRAGLPARQEKKSTFVFGKRREV